MPTDAPELLDPDLWCPLSDRERREMLARAVLDALRGAPGVTGARIEVGPVERPYDYTAVVETDVGDLRTPLWSHARATIFCDPSIHAANRRQLAPALEVDRAADRLRRRLAVPFTLESRGLTLKLEPEPGVERTWTAERSRFRNRTAVSREDVVTAKSEDVDVRDLLAHFYTGPSLRAVADDGTAFLLRAQGEEEGRLITLCVKCGKWQEGAADACPDCGGPTEVVMAVRPPKRTG
ncbi:hypothetical protein [Longimicrobium sp.]|uniref:hypothetical protein n=1 Tax=Longimicrobium sp. TaxID=2029185 RepID=UPI002BCADF0D|nr:hypothetical protein [Longimicrobium sp.]HSU13344.1 hypothetical protein [Longimicrobium sp.]